MCLTWGWSWSNDLDTVRRGVCPPLSIPTKNSLTICHSKDKSRVRNQAFHAGSRWGCSDEQETK